MITINEPKIVKNGKMTRLCCIVEMNDEKKTLWLDVSERYGKYLVKDRCDAFLIAILPIAMRNSKDIICNSPVSEELLHNLRTFLIPTLVKTGKGFYKTRISAEVTKKTINSAGAVGTGLSRGVGSMHVLNEYIDCDYPSMRLTHLLINDVGAYDIPGYSEGKRDKQKIKEECIKESIELAEELDLPYILTSSNLQSEFGLSYAINHVYSNLFPVYALQKLFKFYYYGSSGIDFTEFSLTNSDKRDPSSYELLLTSVFSMSNLRIIPEGGEKNFLEKVEDIIHYAPAHKHLHVCITNSKNCGLCTKCMKTMLAIDSLDKLDYFSQVFDTNYYQQNKKRYTTYLEKCHNLNNKIMEPVYAQFLKRSLLANSMPEVFDEKIVLPQSINTSAIIVKDLTNRKILIKKQTKEKYSAVVCSKILTAILALESGKSQMLLDIPDDLLKGVEKVTLYDLVNVLLISQNNEVGNIIAESVCGSAEEFVVLMNQKMRMLNCSDTKFISVSGFENGNFTTVDDVCLLMEYALRNSYFRQIFKNKSYTINLNDKPKVISTVNPLLKVGNELYLPEAVGIKYGLKGALANSISIIEKNDKLYLMVLLGIVESKNTQNRFVDTYNFAKCIPD